MEFRHISSYLPEQVPANKILFARLVPANKFLFAGTVPANKFLFSGTVPANNLFLIGRYAIKTLFVNKTVPTMISETQGKYTTAPGLK